MTENRQQHTHGEGEHALDKAAQLRLAHSTTLHCLLGCGIGEVVGVIIGTALDLPNLTTLVLAVVLGFVFGFILGLQPLLRAGFNFLSRYSPGFHCRKSEYRRHGIGRSIGSGLHAWRYGRGSHQLALLARHGVCSCSRLHGSISRQLYIDRQRYTAHPLKRIQ